MQLTSNFVDAVQVEGSAGSEEEEEVQDSPRRILATVQNKQSQAVCWSARQRSRRASLSPQSNRQVYQPCHPQLHYAACSTVKQFDDIVPCSKLQFVYACFRAKPDKVSMHQPAFRMTRSPVSGSGSPQAGYSVSDTKHSAFVEVSKQHTPGADLGAVHQPQQPFSFIRTVPMQHVQSNYAEPLLGQGSAEQLTASLQPFLPDKPWLTQLTAPAFMPLISLSPESSCSSMNQHEQLDVQGILSSIPPAGHDV